MWKRDAERAEVGVGQGDLGDNRLAILTSRVSVDSLRANAELSRKFRSTVIRNLPVVRSGNETVPRPDALLIQCGTGDIKLKDTTIVYQIDSAHIVDKLSVQISADSVTDEVYKKVQSDPHKYVMDALGVDRFDDKRTVRTTRTRTFKHKGKMIDRVDCVVFPNAITNMLSYGKAVRMGFSSC